MSFAIRPSESFENSFRGLTSFDAQEVVLDFLEEFREHPGNFIRRDLVPPMPGVMTRARPLVDQARAFGFSILFQYDSDEVTIHLLELIVFPTPIP